jgi:hypothetical protein
MNRRDFAYVSAFAGLVAAQARGERTSGSTGKTPNAAGLITEMVFLDDSVRLAMYDAEISKPAKAALTTFPDFVRNGALSPAQIDTASGEGYALAAGHRISGALTQHRQPDSPDARLYQDIGVMHDLATTAGRNPAKAGPVGDLLDVLHVRRRLGLHTLNPDDDIQNWLEGIVTWWRDQRDLRASLAAIYSSPDNTKMHEYVAGFYNPSDPAIRLARTFQFGEVAPEDAYLPALSRARQGCGYARALAAGLDELRKLPQPTKPIGEMK